MRTPGVHLGNAVKYLMRADHKGSAEEDRRKAAWYLRREAHALTYSAPARISTNSPAWRLFMAERRDSPLWSLLLRVVTDTVDGVGLLTIANHLDPR